MTAVGQKVVTNDKPAACWAGLVRFIGRRSHCCSSHSPVSAALAQILSTELHLASSVLLYHLMVLCLSSDNMW